MLLCNTSGVRCSVSHVTSHLSLTLTATATDFPPLCTVGWFAKTPKVFKNQKKTYRV